MSRGPFALAGAVGLSALVTAVGVGVAFLVELRLLDGASPMLEVVLVGLIEEAFVRLVPLVLTFYLLSVRRDRLLSKTEGLLATVASGATVAGLELAIKLEYLAQLEAAARFDELVLPIVFIHLPLALIAGRFAYWLGERIHGPGEFGPPSLSRRTLLLLGAGYAALALVHLAYNLAV